MLQPLKPDPDQFSKAYPDWIRKTAQLIASSAEGTTFGIFGPWGSGKTSASLALKNAVLRAARGPLQPSDSIAFAYVDCSSLVSASPAEIASSVKTELQRAGVTEGSTELAKDLFTFFRKASDIGKVAAHDPLNKTAMTTISFLADAGLGIEAERRRTAPAKSANAVQIAFVFLDDLDRCDADSAWSILRHARRALPEMKTIYAIVCDPVVLGHHISHVLGVSLAHGFQAVLKYIDVPLKIPTALTADHSASIKSRLVEDLSDDWRLAEVALDAVGSIPIRDVLAALPQASFWLSTWDIRLRPTGYGSDTKMKPIAEVVFFLALLHICVPNAAQVVGSGKKDWLEFGSSLRSVSRGLTGPMKDSTQSALNREFGPIVEQVIAGRMDLVRYFRARGLGDDLASVDVGPKHEKVLDVLWELARS